MFKDLFSVRKHPKRTVIVLAVVLAVMLAGFGCVYSLYVTTSTTRNSISSQNFYFSSDYLADNSPTYTYTDWVAGTPINFMLCNYNQDVNTVTNSADTSFRISASAGTLSQTSGVLTGNTASSVSVSFIPPSAGSFTVTAASTSPYTSSISAVFTVTAAEVSDVSFTLQDSTDFVTMFIVTGPGTSPARQLRLAWDTDTLVADSTNSLIPGYTPAISGNYSYVDFSAPADSSFSIILYKSTSNSQSYAAQSISECASNNHCGVFIP